MRGPLFSNEALADAEYRERRQSQEVLLLTGEDYDLSERGDINRDLSRLSSNFVDNVTSSMLTKQRRAGILQRIRHILTRITFFLLPSFISSYFTNATGNEKLASTAWLDGLRGLACVCVVVHHYAGEYTKTIEDPYNGVTATNLVQLPILKLVHYGPPMVKIFFVISGFVLTLKAVRLTRVTGAIDGSALISNLSLSIWKRYLRLYIPCAAGFVLCAFMISAGMMESVPGNTKPKWLSGSKERRPPTESNIFKQLMYTFWDFYSFGFELTFFRIRDRLYSTDGHLWTIPLEFQCSIQLFIFVAGTCMLKRWLRVYIILPFTYTCLLLYGKWGLSLFIFGYFLAELHSDILASHSLPTDSDEKLALKAPFFKTVLHFIMVFVGLYLMSYPRKRNPSEYTTGFNFLVPWTPKRYPLAHDKSADLSHEFWQSVGSMTLTWGLLYLSRVQKAVLCNKMIQYFGKISFALYIMHAHIQHSVGYWVVVNGLKLVGVWRYNPKSKTWDIESGHEGRWNAVIIGGFFLVTFPMTVCSADIFWRAIDLQSVRFLRWLEPKIKR